MSPGAKRPSKKSADELISTPCDHDDETINKLLREGKALLVGGVFVLNEGANIAKIVRVIKAQTTPNREEPLRGIHGWIFIVGDPSSKGLYYIESGQGNAGSMILSLAMTSIACFAAVINDEVVEKGVNWPKLKKAIDHALGAIDIALESTAKS